jgi:O-antigen ligase
MTITTPARPHPRSGPHRERTTPPADVVASAGGVRAAAVGSPWPFRFLILFSFVLFLAPQAIFTFLIPLMLGKTLAGLALVVYLIDRLGAGRPLTVRAREIGLGVALVAAAIASVPFSRWPGGSIDALVEMLKSVLIFFLLANAMSTWRRVRGMFVALVCFGVVLATQAALAFARGEFVIAGRISGYDAPLTANPNDLALTLNLILGLLIGLGLTARRRLSRVVLMAAGGLFAMGTILTFSRGGFLGLVTLCAVATKRFVPQKTLALVVAAAVLGLAVIVAPSGYLDRLYSIVNTDADETGSAQARMGLMKEALALSLQNPVLGVGLGMSALALTERGFWWTTVHNAYLQIALEIGVGGLVIYMLLVGSLLVGARKAMRTLAAVGDRAGMGYLHGFQIALYCYLVEAFFHPVAFHFYLFYLAGIGVALQTLASATRGKGGGAPLAAAAARGGARGALLPPALRRAGA